MTLRFLFWNLRLGRGTQIDLAIAQLARFEFDVLMFCESPEVNRINHFLNEGGVRYARVPHLSQRVHFYLFLNGALRGARCHAPFFNAVADRITVLELEPIGASSIRIVGAHLTSRATLISSDGQAELARTVMDEIRTVEDDANHERTIIVGDLNMNPFDLGLISPSAFHGVMTRQLVREVSSHKARKGHRVLYNPMWSLFGDAGERAAGTYFFPKTQDPVNHFWQMYDQVLLRPEIMNALGEIRILDRIGSLSLLTHSGRPNEKKWSDHLPLFFELNW